MVQAVGNENILINVKRRGDPLCKHIRDVVVGIRPAVKLRPESSLPFLGLHYVMRVRRVKDKALELQLADTPPLWPHLKRHVGVLLIRIRPLDKPGFRIEIGSDLSPRHGSSQPVRFVG